MHRPIVYFFKVLVTVALIPLCASLYYLAVLGVPGFMYIADNWPTITGLVVLSVIVAAIYALIYFKWIEGFIEGFFFALFCLGVGPYIIAGSPIIIYFYLIDKFVWPEAPLKEFIWPEKPQEITTEKSKAVQTKRRYWRRPAKPKQSESKTASKRETQRPKPNPATLSPAPPQKPLIPAPAKTPPPPNHDPDSFSFPPWPDDDEYKPPVNDGITWKELTNPDWKNDNGTETTTRPAQPEVEVNLLHKRMQDEIIKCLLKEKVPERKVYREYKNVDVLVHDKDVFTLIEIKTDPNVWKNIRDGLGQLLEYQFILRPYIQHKKNKLIIVSPAQMNNEASEYLNYLNASGKLEVEYKQYVPGSFSFSFIH